ncbi:PQQ-binding-like beta-propeller repeat protein [Nocardioides sp. CFH 31398]|uniref:outer membrane protein assembly factor BamB family protein n=1 Tax=Nocardioides sp. CFH 31398 TaxID=2919579 RepID=UPI001F06887A|nr:PQQ-binding-like beta-propeller repeat protein [Nocardioides sp. CFH 31398]MCH1867155.1 PQQ-binding-like beta-propeller repeat protein [Nocardioides sp. CFH 31398]
MTPRRPLACAALAVLVLLGGCSGGGADAPASSDPGVTAPAAEAPQVRFTDAASSSRSGRLPELLALGEGVVVVREQPRGTQSRLRVVDTRTGRTAWRLPGGEVDRGARRTSYLDLGAEVGPDGAGGEIVAVPYQDYTCEDPRAEVGACRVRPGLEARDALTGEVLWRWDAPRPGKATSIALGLSLTEDATLLDDDGRLVALDPETGEPLWRATANVPVAVGDGVAVVGPDPGEAGPSRVVDLATGETVRSLGPDRGTVGLVGLVGLVGDVLAVDEGDVVRLEDARTGEEVGTVEGDQPPVAVRADHGLAWRSGDTLLTLVPGETEPVGATLPDEVADANLALSFFAGGAGDGVWLLSTDGVVRTMGRDGALDGRPGPDAVLVQDVAGADVALQVEGERSGSGPPVEVRRVR